MPLMAMGFSQCQWPALLREGIAHTFCSWIFPVHANDSVPIVHILQEKKNASSYLALCPSASLPLPNVREAVFMVFNVGIPPALLSHPSRSLGGLCELCVSHSSPASRLGAAGCRIPHGGRAQGVREITLPSHRNPKGSALSQT